VLRKEALEKLKQRNSTAFIESMAALALGSSSPRADDNLLVVDIDPAERLEAISQFLINKGLRLTNDGNLQTSQSFTTSTDSRCHAIGSWSRRVRMKDR
jgi:hypothetical protein